MKDEALIQLDGLYINPKFITHIVTSDGRGFVFLQGDPTRPLEVNEDELEALMKAVNVWKLEKGRWAERDPSPILPSEFTMLPKE